MRVVYTQGALSDLENILGGLHSINPLAAAAVERSIGATVARVANWPRSARMVAQWRQGNVRIVPLVRYPYVIFYQSGSRELRYFMFGIRRAHPGKQCEPNGFYLPLPRKPISISPRPALSACCWRAISSIARRYSTGITLTNLGR